MTDILQQASVALHRFREERDAVDDALFDMRAAYRDAFDWLESGSVATLDRTAQESISRKFNEMERIIEYLKIKANDHSTL